ncbi:YT521-B-like domain-containing protein [Paraphoma chrysanthemicola]|nr:YT521-B-like domain-containing protein [Paraphoma chrysanthemicola]
MGDAPPASRPQALDSAATGFARDGNQSQSTPGLTPYKAADNNTPFYSQLSSIPQNQLRPDFRSSSHPSAQYAPPEHGASPLNMGSMMGALPEYGSVDDGSLNTQSQQSISRSLSGASTSAVVYQLGQNLQMPTQASGSFSNQASYGSAFAPGQYQQPFMAPHGPQHGAYPSFTPNQSRMPGGTSMQTPYQNYPQASPYMYYPAPYANHAQYSPGYLAQSAQSLAGFERRGSMTSQQIGLQGQQMNLQSHEGSFTSGRLPPGTLQSDQTAISSTFGAPLLQAQGMPRAGPVSSIPRGPPRKPKQSGHALWVGNLPPGTTVVALKDHFSREATKDIESLFLISKSNCAFVNYRSETSCTAAMHRFHDSRFSGVRLVCRLRRSSAPASGIPTGPSAMVGSHQINTSPPKTPKLDSETVGQNPEGEAELPTQQRADVPPEEGDASNKYFIVKSLTLQDLELSVRNGIWATQSHNEDVLNKAFRSAENVFLIFSANKSGEYFGYARMVSPILEEDTRLIGSAPKPENILDAPDVPKSIATPATEWAPRGKIIDDSARGTIFWEAELSEEENEEQSSEKDDAQVEGDASAVAQSWGKPFKIEWMSTNRLPFYRTRGLRNPWNANREVKIARDGTELEPSVGERLVQMFHRLGPSNAGVPMMPPHPQLGGPGMPQMRPY